MRMFLWQGRAWLRTIAAVFQGVEAALQDVGALSLGLDVVAQVPNVRGDVPGERSTHEGGEGEKSGSGSHGEFETVKIRLRP
jgi:hypothetical protein